jgi:hypothetical protein
MAFLPVVSTLFGYTLSADLTIAGVQCLPMGAIIGPGALLLAKRRCFPYIGGTLPSI